MDDKDPEASPPTVPVMCAQIGCPFPAVYACCLQFRLWQIGSFPITARLYPVISTVWLCHVHGAFVELEDVLNYPANVDFIAKLRAQLEERKGWLGSAGSTQLALVPIGSMEGPIEELVDGARKTRLDLKATVQVRKSMGGF